MSARAKGQSFNLFEKSENVLPETTPIVPLLNAQMASGTGTRVPPSGYCIEPSSLTPKFAAIARYDLLEAKNSALDKPIGLLTVSVAKSRANAVSMSDILSASNATMIETMTKSYTRDN